MEGCLKSSYGTMAEGGIEDNPLESSSSLRFILVGRSGCGKSATGNSILGQPVFDSRMSPRTVTKTCQQATGMWNGRKILVVDTPPILEAEALSQDMYKDIGDCYLFSAPGPHVLLLVTQLGRFTSQDTIAVRGMKEMFGEEAVSHAVVLFTHREDLGNESLQEYVCQTDNFNLRSLIQECEGRYCGFNNRATKEEQEAQLEELMVQVQSLEEKHGGACYSNNLFLEAELFRKSGGSDQNYGHYLAKVKAQVEKHKQDLKESERRGVSKVLLRVQNWICSHVGLSAFIVICILIYLAVLINWGIARRH